MVIASTSTAPLCREQTLISVYLPDTHTHCLPSSKSMAAACRHIAHRWPILHSSQHVLVCLTLPRLTVGSDRRELPRCWRTTDAADASGGRGVTDELFHGNHEYIPRVPRTLAGARRDNGLQMCRNATPSHGTWAQG